jgi:hypothetical protein
MKRIVLILMSCILFYFSSRAAYSYPLRSLYGSSSQIFTFPDYTKFNPAFMQQILPTALDAVQDDNVVAKKITSSAMDPVFSACASVGKGCVSIMTILAPYFAQYLPHILSGSLFATALGVYTVAKVRENGKKIDGINDKVDTLADEMHTGFKQATQERALLAKAEQVQQITTELDALADALNQGLGKTNQTIQNQTTQLAERLDGIQQILNELKNKELAEAIAPLQEQLFGLEKNFLDQLQEKLQHADTSIKDFLQNKLDVFQQKIGTLDRRLVNLEEGQEVVLSNQNKILRLLQKKEPGVVNIAVFNTGKEKKSKKTTPTVLSQLGGELSALPSSLHRPSFSFGGIPQRPLTGKVVLDEVVSG